MSQFTSEFIQSSFHSDEPVKDIASRLGFDYPLLSSAWKNEFGEDAFKARINRLKSLASKRSHDNGTRKKADFSEVEITCTECRNAISVKTIAACQMDTSKFICENCSGDRDCPVCGQRVNGDKGLIRHFSWRRKAGSVEHIAYEDSLKPVLIEGEDYVVCLECGAKETSLGAHLVKHDMSSRAYREKHGPDSLIHSEKTKRKKSLAARSRADYGKGSLKSVACPDCGSSWIGSKFLVPGTHDLRCDTCKNLDNDRRWDGFLETEDYVVCLECGHKADSIVSHIQSKHPGYKLKFPSAEVVCLRSGLRDKTLLKGKSIPHKPRPSGFTRRVSEDRRKITHKGYRRVQLEDSVLIPFLDENGELDVREAGAQLGLSEYVVLNNALSQGLKKKRISCVKLQKEDLEPFLIDGVVSVSKASATTGHSNHVLLRECRRHGLSVRKRSLGQNSCLELISKILNLRFHSEWNSWAYRDEITGHRYRFDGFFKELGLVVEFQGHQHYTFPNRYHKTMEDHEDCLRRDRAKKAMIEGTPGLTFFEVFEYEPFTDESYMRGRLHQAGFIRPAIAASIQTSQLNETAL